MLNDYQSNEKIESKYGQPIFAYWHLYQLADSECDKQSFAFAYHFISNAAGKTLPQAKELINSYTMCLCKQGSAEYRKSADYCEAPRFGYFYGESTWDDEKFGSYESQVQPIRDAFKTTWAKILAKQFDVDLTKLSV